MGSPNGAKFNSPTQRVGSTLPKPISPERAKQLISPFQGLSAKPTYLLWRCHRLLNFALSGLFKQLLNFCLLPFYFCLIPNLTGIWGRFVFGESLSCTWLASRTNYSRVSHVCKS